MQYIIVRFYRGDLRLSICTLRSDSEYSYINYYNIILKSTKMFKFIQLYKNYDLLYARLKYT